MSIKTVNVFIICDKISITAFYRNIQKIMKKRLFSVVFLLFVLLNSSHLLAEEVLLRHGLKDDVLRIVLQTQTDRYVTRAKVYSTYSLVKVEFPGEFTLQPEGVDYDRFEFNKKGNNLYLNIRNLRWIKLIRLKSPPRLVIDAYLKRIEEPSKPETVRPERESPPVKAEGEGTGTEKAPEKKGQIKKIKIILIDPGHGGRQLGNYSSNYNEKSLTLRVGRTLRYMLRRRGYRVYMTRTDDSTVSLMKRIFYIKKRHPHLMISFHLSTSNNFVIYTESEQNIGDEQRYLFRYSQQRHLQESKALSKAIGEALLKSFNINVLYRQMDIPILAYTDAPAVIVELPNPEFFQYKRKNIGEIAKTILKAITDYEQN